MTFNELLEECGEFGLYQKFLGFGFLAPTLFLVSFTYWTQVFILLVPPHRCKLGPDDNTWIPRNSSDLLGRQPYQCYIEYYSSSNLRNETASDHFGNQTSESDGCPHGWVYDYSSHYPSFASENDWVCEDAWKMYVVHTCYWTGAMVGAILFGFISDRYGRKKAYQMAVLMTLTSDVLSIFAKSQLSFCVMRFFSALGEGNISTLAFVLVIEYTGPSKRRINLFIWSGTYTLTTTIIPWIVFGVHNWKYILITSWLPSMSVLILTHFIPESASWLLTRGEVDKAVALVQRMAKVNGKDLSYNYIKASLQKQQVSVESNKNEEPKKKKIDLKKTEDVKKEKTDLEENMSFLQATIGLLRSPNLRKKTIFLIILWMISCICYNGNNLESGHLPFAFYMAYSIGGIIELPGNFFVIYTLDRLGRRWTTSGFFLLGGALGILGGYVNNSTWTLVLALIMRCCYASAFDIVFTFSSELFPTVVRGRGISIIRTFGSVGSAIAPLIVTLAENDPLLPLIVFGVLAVFGGVLVLFLPETAKQHLSHTLEDGEHFGKDQSFWLCPFSQKENEKSECDSKVRAISNGKDNSGYETNFYNGVKILTMKSLNSNI